MGFARLALCIVVLIGLAETLRLNQHPPLRFVGSWSRCYARKNFPPVRNSGGGSSAMRKPVVAEGAKGVRLEAREGARALTRAEKKAKDQLEGSRDPEVPRLHSPESRVPLSSLEVGQKLRGRVISIKDFGMFVDVGSKRDGLVHIKDVSKDYFIQNLEQKFVLGQDIDVWVKFSEEKHYKLGLQMFPLTEKERLQAEALAAAANGNDDDDNNAIAPLMQEVALPMEDLVEEDEVEGTVVRVSNYGVFVDIGSEVEAFLHRRKMRVPKKRRALKPWEITPLGSKITGYVYDVQHDRRRISITTYKPEEWDTMLPPKVDADEARGEEDDDEELGGSSRALNLRALERTLALSLDDDDDDDDDADDENDDAGENLSADEVRSLLANSDRSSKVVIDDFASSGGSKKKGAAAGSSKGAKVAATEPEADEVMSEMRRSTSSMGDIEQGEDISVEELFAELSFGKQTVNIKDIKKWDYVKTLLIDGDIDEDDLKEMMEEAGGVQGKLNEEQFEDFLDVLADSLGLEEEGGEFDRGLLDEYDAEEDIDGEEEEEEGDVLVMDDTATASATKPSTQKNSDGTATSYDDDDESDFSQSLNDDGVDESEFTAKGKLSTVAGVSNAVKEEKTPLSGIYEKKGSKTNDLLQYVFNSVAGKKGHVVLDDVLKWEFVTSLVSLKTLEEKQVIEFFEKAVKKERAQIKGQPQRLLMASFEELLSMLSEGEKQGKRNAQPITPTIVPPPEQLDEKPSKKPMVEIKLTRAISFSNEPTDFSDDDFVGQDDEDELEDEVSVEEVFEELSKGAKTVTFDAVARWEVVNELLEAGVLTTTELSEMFSKAGAKGRKTLTLTGFETLLDLLAPLAEGDDDEEDFLHKEEETSMNSRHTTLIEDEEEEEDEAGADDAEDDDAELLANVFKGLCGTKKYASAKDLMNWDFVLDLMGEGLLTEDLLREKMKEMGGEKGVDLAQFDKLVDSLVDLYGKEDEEGDNDDDDDEEEGSIVGGSGETQSRRINQEEMEEEGEYYDIDTEAVFEDVSKGKKLISMNDLRNWDLIKQMTAAGQMNEEELKSIVESAGVVDTEAMTILDFEAICDEMMTRADEEE